MKFYKKTIRSIAPYGDTILLRADFNVPLDASGKISDDFRIDATLPTINYLLERNCKVVIISHLGRPFGKDERMSLSVVAERLKELVGNDKVKFIKACYGDKVHQAARLMSRGTILLLENLRFHEGEERNSFEFAKKIYESVLPKYFVQDAFGVLHRKHASIDAITLLVPSVAGILVEREFEIITEAVHNPARPFVAIMGGSKASDKIGVLEQFVDKADKILVGGAMANTILANAGKPFGRSKFETGQGEVIQRIYDKIRESGKDEATFIDLPTDVAVAEEISESAQRTIKEVDSIGSEDIVLDVGDKTIENFASQIEQAKTVIWNGTLGYAELEQFSHGSSKVALTLATHPEITSVIGGGDTANFAVKWDSKKGGSFTHVSTGGGVSLDLIAGKELPGIDSLLDAY